MICHSKTCHRPRTSSCHNNSEVEKKQDMGLSRLSSMCACAILPMVLPSCLHVFLLSVAAQDAERELLARLRDERLAREAEEEKVAAAAALLAPPEPEEPAKKPKGVVGKMKSKILKQLGLKKSKSAAALGVVAGAGAAAAEAAAAAADDDESPLGEYGWYGGVATAEQKAAVAAIDAAIAKQKQLLPTTAAADDGDDDESSPKIGTYARGADGQPLIGFDAKPLLLGSTEDGTPLVLGSNGEVLLGPGGEQIVLILDAEQKPVVDPRGRPVLLALEVMEKEEQQQVEQQQEGMSRSASVAQSLGEGSVAGVTGQQGLGEGLQQQQEAVVAAAATAVADDGLGAIESSTPSGFAAAAAGDSVFERAEDKVLTDTDTPGSVRAASGTVTPPGAGVFEQAPTPAEEEAVASALPLALASAAETEASPVTPSSRAPRQFAIHPDGSLVLNSAGQPAALVLGQDGAPVLGRDFRPLVIADDEEGRVLHLGLDQEQQLVGPDGQKLLLAVTSQGVIVALTEESNMLTSKAEPGRQ